MGTLRTFLVGGALTVAAGGCFTSQKGNTVFDPSQVNSFKVTITSGPVGTAGNPVAYVSSGSGITYGLSITALNSFGQTLTNYAGPVTVSAVPGHVFGSSNIVFDDKGVGTGSVQVVGAFGPTRIWVEDGVPPDSIAYQAGVSKSNLATGLSPTINIRGLTLYDIRISPNTVDVPFDLQRVVIDTASQLLVTGVDSTGFYVTDINAAPGPNGGFPWASIYSYNFSQPQGVAPGDIITNLVGTEFDFLGEAQLDGPTWNSTGKSATVPPNVVLNCAQIEGVANQPNLEMEQFVGQRVELDNVQIQICGTWLPGAGGRASSNDGSNCPDYVLYEEWTAAPVNNPNCLIDVSSNVTLSGFDPNSNQNNGQGNVLTGNTAANVVITRLQGELGYVQYANPSWFIYPQGPQDVCCPNCTPAFTQGC